MDWPIYRLDISVKRETVADPGEDISRPVTFGVRCAEEVRGMRGAVL